MRRFARTLLPAVAVALLLPLAPLEAQNKPTVRDVEVVVRDIDARQDIGVVQPGGTISIPEGSRVRLVMRALPVGGARGPVYPATDFTDLTRGGARITRSNAENSTADVDVGSFKGSNRVQAVGFDIRDNWVPADLRHGRIFLHVGAADGYSGSSTYGSTYGTSLAGSRAEQLTRMLYQAILLRDLDSGARGTVESIANGGYDALVDAAVGIARSPESMDRLPGQGVSVERRLNSLYENLLGISPGRVDRAQYDSDLRRVAAGRIDQVVSDMVRSESFRSRHNIAATRY